MMCKHHKVVLYISILLAVVSVSEQALWAMPTQYTPEAHRDGCLLSLLFITRAGLSTLTSTS